MQWNWERYILIKLNSKQRTIFQIDIRCIEDAATVLY